MKKLLVFTFLCLSTLSFSQKQKYTMAKVEASQNNLEAALENIEIAIKDPKVNSKHDAWALKGELYFKILNSEEEKYNRFDKNRCKTSYISYKKAIELYDGKSSRKLDDFKGKISLINNMAFNKGINLYNEKKYQDAAEYLELAYEVSTYLKKETSLELQNLGLVYENLKNYSKAEFYYKTAINKGYDNENTCYFLLYTLMAQNKNEEYVTQLNKCRAKDPNNLNLLFSDINLNLNLGNNEKSLALINQALETESTNVILKFTKATILEKLGNKKEAENAYLEVITLKPDYFDALYNLGAFYFNDFADLSAKMNEEINEAAYTDYKTKANKLMEKALVYIEKARSIKPNDRGVLIALQEIYVRTGDMEKFKEVKDALSKQ
jgi:tetratricopeptide (TPR) repeat protein